MALAVETPLTRRQRLTRTRVYRALLRRVAPDLLMAAPNPASSNRFANLPLTAQVIAYFAEDYTRSYQLEQWLPVLDQLHEKHPVLIVTRTLAAFRVLSPATTLPIVYARRLRDFNDVIATADPRVFLYVNNGVSNFQALGWPRSLHLHLNHGESDKISMATNQAKAYDQVFVAGPAAEQRYADNLLDLDRSKLVPVGRPQLDLTFDPVVPESQRTTVLYAPTWEGETPAMNYNSLIRFGEAIVAGLVSDPGFRVLYKPHPRLLTGTQQAQAAHAAVVRRLEEANAALAPADQHVVVLDAPILALFPSTDVLISDVSSVALDWLYLRTDAPVWVADPRDDREALRHASPMTSCSYVLDQTCLPDVATRMRASIVDDRLGEARREQRRFYFGDLQPGESTARFLEAVSAAIERCERLLAERRREHHDFELAAGVS